jgi:hypothetical protein
MVVVVVVKGEGELDVNTVTSQPVCAFRPITFHDTGTDLVCSNDLDSDHSHGGHGTEAMTTLTQL